ncbi:MAG: GH25 family lysozyme [Porcipelethomonas sp.]
MQGVIRKKAVVLSAAIIASAISAALYLYLSGTIILNNPDKDKYPVRGVDVSSYQGKIDWDILASQDISFAYIKATEGSSYQDENFLFNYENAQKTMLRTGAYHFFSYDSPGKTQAENFMSAVYKCENMLPPVVDIEFYGDKGKNPPEADTVRKELSTMLNMLEENYEVKPVIYATNKSYDLYIKDHFGEYDIWIRNVFSEPELSGKREWKFWQYTDKERLDGYIGKEKFIDMNVFNGSRSDFEKYAE